MTATPRSTRPEVRLVVVTAGLSRPSSTRLLADRLTQATRDQLDAAGLDARPRVIELRELASDIAGHQVAGFPSPALREALDAVSDADAVIAVTPVFAASYSGLFKSFFDLVEPDALAGVPVLIGATGGTPRHSLALEHAMRPLFTHLHATVAPTGVYAATEDWGGDGDRLTDTLPARVERAGRELAALLAMALLRPAPEATPGPTPESAPESASPERTGEPVVPVVPFEQQLAAVRAGG